MRISIALESTSAQTENVLEVFIVLRVIERYKKVSQVSRALIISLSYTSPLIRKYIPVVKSPPNHTSLPSMAATFLTTRLMVVVQPSGYSVFHGGDTPIQLVFHDRVTPVSVSTLKPPLGVIGVLPLKS